MANAQPPLTNQRNDLQQKLINIYTKYLNFFKEKCLKLNAHLNAKSILSDKSLTINLIKMIKLQLMLLLCKNEDGPGT